MQQRSWWKVKKNKEISDKYSYGKGTEIIQNYWLTIKPWFDKQKALLASSCQEQANELASAGQLVCYL